jgi:hypothetical protein
MNLDRAQSDLDRCPNCKCALEIAAVKFGFLYRPIMLFVCPNCGLIRENAIKRIGVRDRVAALAGKRLSPLPSSRYRLLRLVAEALAARHERHQ